MSDFTIRVNDCLNISINVYYITHVSFCQKYGVNFFLTIKKKKNKRCKQILSLVPLVTKRKELT
jgi:hypothetical protein